jgi:hypothetical protein
MDVSDLASVVLAAVPIVALGVAWSQWREVVRRRHVDMYWRIFEAYNSEELRRSRKAFFDIESRLGLDRPSGRTRRITDRTELERYSERYWREFYKGDLEDQETDLLARARVRFYDQTGLLLREGLVNEDLVFGLIGPMLDVDMRLLDIVIEANRTHHESPRMSEDVEYANREYERWWGQRHDRTEGGAAGPATTSDGEGP